MTPAPERILVIRRRAFGDLLLTLPALHALRRAHPRAGIHLAVDPPLVAPARAWAPVDTVLPYPDRSTGGGWRRAAALRAFAREARERRYDWVLDVHSTPQTAWVTGATQAPVRVGLDLQWRRSAYTHRVPRSVERLGGRRTRYMADAFLDFVRAVGVPTEGVPLTGFLPQAHPSPARGTRPRLALAPGATWGAKAWPPAAYAELARRACDAYDAEVTVYGGPGEEAVVQSVVTAVPAAARAPRLGVEEWAASLATQDLLVSGDSGARHLAIALGVPCIGLFGPTDPWGSTPPGGGWPWFRYPIACSPCQRLECPLAENYCLTRVSASEVWDEVARRLAHRAASPAGGGA